MESLDGLREIRGAKHELAIVGMHRRIYAWITDDETPWCAAAMSAMFDLAGYADPATVRARDFEDYGVEACTPEVGRTIVVLSRGRNPAKGHVGFFAGFSERGGVRYVEVLGGNQSNAINVAAYRADRVVAYRDPEGPILSKRRVVTAGMTPGEMRRAMVRALVNYAK